LFEGINSREEAAMLRKAVIEVQEKNLPALPENKFYHRQIIGLIVVTPEGKKIGQIAEIIETGSNDVYVVKGQGKEYLIPAIKDVISCIDLSSGTVIIAPMRGLLD
jgi:16S rRNA processing protein RimM